VDGCRRPVLIGDGKLMQAVYAVEDRFWPSSNLPVLGRRLPCQLRTVAPTLGVADQFVLDL
jgi:hypothetical protein